MPRKIHPLLKDHVPKTKWTSTQRARYRGRKEFYDILIRMGVNANRALARTINFDPLKRSNTQQKGHNDRKRHKGSPNLGRSRSKS